MRIGVFGGSFDPPHSAHVQVASAAREQLKLDRVIWVVSFSPPHKNTPVTPFEHRIGMVKSLLFGDDSAEVSDVEASLPSPSYTLQTLLALKTIHGQDHAWHLIIGADNWNIFPNWHQPQAVLKEATLAVYPRHEIALNDLPPGGILLDCPEIAMESSRYRERLHANPKSLEELPIRVADYIRRHGLYGMPPESIA